MITRIDIRLRNKLLHPIPVLILEVLASVRDTVPVDTMNTIIITKKKNANEDTTRKQR